MRMEFFFFNDTATTEIYTLSLHDALPICRPGARAAATLRLDRGRPARRAPRGPGGGPTGARPGRSEEHTSELQSRLHLVCRLLLEKKNRDSRCAYLYRRHHQGCRRLLQSL